MTRTLLPASRRVLWAAVAVAALPAAARAVYWNNDPAFGVTSSTGLTDMPIWFGTNDQVIYNDSNSTRGTAILLNNEWALSVRHVVQNGGDYGSIANPTQISVNVAGVGGYFVDQIFTPDGGSEISLLHLRGGVNGAQNLAPNVNSGTDENGRIVQVGGYGLWGQVNTTGAGGTNAGTSSSSVAFHRAYNTIEGIPNGQLQITQNNDANMRNNGLLEGIAGSGDSGGPMFAFYGTNFATQQNDKTQWRLVGLTATSAGPTQGASSQYTRVSSYSGFITSKMNSYGIEGASKTGAWTQDSGNNLYAPGTNRISVTGSTVAPVAHAKFGTNNAGYTLGSVGDKINFSATLDTPYAMASGNFRFGLYDDAGGALAGNVNGGAAWNGYLALNASENAPGGLYKKGANGGGTGAYWSYLNSNASPQVSSAAASGTYDDGSGTGDSAPAGTYSLTMTLTRLAAGLQIDWTMTQLTDAAYVLNTATGQYGHNATPGSYSLSGSFLDTNPASSTWTYDELGVYLYGAATSDRTVVLDNINVGYTAVPEPAMLAGLGGVAGFLRRRRRPRSA